MKIYHKKNFAAGLFFTLLGAAYLVLFLVKGEVRPKSVLFCVLSLLIGLGLLLRSLDRGRSYQDKIDERDERNILVKLHAKSLTCSIIQYALLGACILCTAGALLYQNNPEGQLVFGGMLVVSGVMWFVSLLAELLCQLHYEKRL